MSNRIDTVEATLQLLKRMEKKGVRSVYLDGVEIPNSAASRAPTHAAAIVRETAPAPATGDTVEKLAALAKTVSVCTRCALHATRTQTVFGVGNPQAKLMFIG